MEGSSGPTARKITSNGIAKTPHPYPKFEGTALWTKVNRAVDALVKNGDIQETTRREYIVGYICKIVGFKDENRNVGGRRVKERKD